MQSTRFLAANMLRQQPTMALLRFRATPMLRVQMPAARSFQTGGRRMAMPKEEHAAHTISQRIRSLKKIPVELIPIGIVLAAALLAAAYSIIRKFTTDKTLRLTRQGPQGNH